MAPKDPLLGTLKVCVLSLQSEGGLVTDNSPHLASCCELLELLLRKGLQQPVLSLVHRDYWHCFEQLNHKDACGRLSSLSLVLEQTRVCRKLLSAQGRGRFLLRLALHRRVLPQLLTHLLHTPRVLEWYSPEVSILRNEAFLEPFMSLLLVLANMDFKLDMENCSFLDESWILPVCEKYEVVPCREVGLVLRYLSGRVFVLDLTPGGQAHVDNFIRPGDIIDEINGTSLRNSKNGQAGVVLSRLKGLPLSIGVLRWRAGDGTVFRPLVKLLRNLKTENPSLQLGPQAEPHTEPEEQNPSQCLKDGRIVYIVQFLGKANIGMHGGKEVLQHAITQVLQKNQQSKEVLLDLKETHLTCTDRDSKQELLEHHYPEISCVGRYGQPDYTVFAFCVADSPETPLSTGFCCVAFRAQSIRECEDMVCRIATGFKHTEWFV
ncbi:hypothetical protein NQZ68_011119 [Dissostichus eleginoides]|nr:hypothetical protein NQZ68_011119 [Dissostichus eleginoides]